MELGLAGRRAWVAGGSSGLGRAIAASLAAEGAAVAISARDPARLEQAAAELGAAGGHVVAVPLDVTDAAAIPAAAERVVAELGGLDVLVSNHGGPPAGGVDAIDADGFDAAYDLVLASAFRLTKAALPALEDGGGTIVYVTSSSTKEVIPNLLLSNVMRLGVLGLAKTLSKELAPRGVRVVCVAPGRIDTDRVRALDATAAERSGSTTEELRRRSEASIPFGRYGRPDELGDVVAFLCSDRASYVTGTTVVIDGGKLSGVLS